MAIGDDINETSFHKNPPRRVTGLSIDGNGTVRPKYGDFGADACSLNDSQLDNLSDDEATQKNPEKSWCSRNVFAKQSRI